jgi:hypothetical protein
VTPEQYRRVGQIYHHALEFDRGQRAAFLDRECEGDEELRREVESLIAAHEQTETFLNAPAVEVLARSATGCTCCAGRNTQRGPAPAHKRRSSLQLDLAHW